MQGGWSSRATNLQPHLAHLKRKPTMGMNQWMKIVPVVSAIGARQKLPIAVQSNRVVCSPQRGHAGRNSRKDFVLAPSPEAARPSRPFCRAARAKNAPARMRQITPMPPTSAAQPRPPIRRQAVATAKKNPANSNEKTASTMFIAPSTLPGGVGHDAKLRNTARLLSPILKSDPARRFVYESADSSEGKSDRVPF
jgi:hypothetical protein